MLTLAVLSATLFGLASGDIVGQYETRDGTTLNICLQRNKYYFGINENGLVNGLGEYRISDSDSSSSSSSTDGSRYPIVLQSRRKYFHLNTYSLNVGYKLEFSSNDDVTLTVDNANLDYSFTRVSNDQDLTACLAPPLTRNEKIYGRSFVRYNEDNSINDIESFPNDFLPSMCYACCENSETGDFYNGQVNGLQSFRKNRIVFGQYDTSSGVNTGNQMFVLTEEGLVTSFIEPGFSLTIDIGIPVETDPECPVPL